MIFTTHARERIAERGLTEAVIEAIVRQPIAAGPEGRGDRYATGVAVVGGRRAFVTAVLEGGDRDVVVTVYDGKPTVHNRTQYERQAARKAARRAAPAGRRRR